jgi:hypothetical protein
LLRFLATAHTLLGHISTLGVHRQVIGPEPARDVITHAGALTIASLERLANALTNHASAPASDDAELSKALETDGIDDETAQLVLGQLTLVLVQRDRLALLASTIHAG